MLDNRHTHWGYLLRLDVNCLRNKPSRVRDLRPVIWRICGPLSVSNGNKATSASSWAWAWAELGNNQTPWGLNLYCWMDMKAKYITRMCFIYSPGTFHNSVEKGSSELEKFEILISWVHFLITLGHGRHPQNLWTSSSMESSPSCAPGNTKEILKTTKEITPLAVLNFFHFKLNILTTLGLWVWFYRS